MKVLVINCGSSSAKFQVFDMAKNEVLMSGVCERIGVENSFIRYKSKFTDKANNIENEKMTNIIVNVDMVDHDVAMKVILEKIVDENGGKHTSHTTNKVDFIIVDNKKYILKDNMSLCNIAATVLQVLEIDKPKEISAESIIEELKYEK